jgi:hypothetical protein
MDKKDELDLIMKEIHRQAMMSCILSGIAVGISSLALIIAIIKILQKFSII